VEAQSPKGGKNVQSRNPKLLSGWLSIVSEMDIRRYFIVGVVILLMMPVAGCSKELTSREIVAKACDATSKVESYRVMVSTISTIEG